MFSENDINNIDDEWDSFCDDEKAQREEDNTGFCYRTNDLLKSGRNKEFNGSATASLAPASLAASSLAAASLGPASLGPASLGPASLAAASLGPASLTSNEILSSKLYISTTTIISYLNTSIDISSLFWKIPIIGYSTPTEGVIKKQMKFILNSQKELDEITQKREMYEYTNEFIINKCSKNSKKDIKDIKKRGGRQKQHLAEQAKQEQAKQEQAKQDQAKQDQAKQEQAQQEQAQQTQAQQTQAQQTQAQQTQAQQTQAQQTQAQQEQAQQTQAQQTQAQEDSKIKYIRKISIGICKKDIKSYRCKQKGAFMNCFVVILRILINDVFKEIHVKVFNTGKLEIPGIQSSAILNDVLILLVKLLRPFVSDSLNYLPDKSETVLINSNFNCGYYINREKLYEILKHKYNINSVYDPCSYPGIQCEIYYNTTLKIQKNAEESPLVSLASASSASESEDYKKNNYKISFMVFRTGSVLIVGKCNETILYELYDFLCDILKKEYIYIKNSQKDIKKKEVVKNLKLRKIYISV
jgi:chemotaxis protein histidine kinase CheA